MGSYPPLGFENPTLLQAKKVKVNVLINSRHPEHVSNASDYGYGMAAYFRNLEWFQPNSPTTPHLKLAAAHISTKVELDIDLDINRM